MGLGSAAQGQVSLAEASAKAMAARKLLNCGIDPLVERETQKRAAVVFPSFDEFADDYLGMHRQKFRNAKQVAQWEMTLSTYCGPFDQSRSM